MGLSKKQRDFVDHYVTHWNATKAAIDAGYSEKSARSIASENLTKPDIQAAIEAEIAQIMPKGEVVQLLAARARSTIADVLRLPFLGPMPEGHPPQAIDGWAIDLIKAQQTGAIHQVKKIKSGKWGPEIEMYDPHPARELVAKYHGMLVERTEVTGKDGGPITVVSAADLAAARAKAQAWEETQDG
jgi:phage terminase small subunit